MNWMRQSPQSLAKPIAAAADREPIVPETLSIPANMEALPGIFQWTDSVADKAGLPDWTRYALLLCLEEAVSNVIRYGYPDDHREASNDEVHLTLNWDDDAATLTIEDHGIPFDPRALAEPSLPKTVEEATIGGLGIHLMRRYAETMNYDRHAGANRLTLRIRRNAVDDR